MKRAASTPRHSTRSIEAILALRPRDASAHLNMSAEQVREVKIEAFLREEVAPLSHDEARAARLVLESYIDGLDESREAPAVQDAARLSLPKEAPRRYRPGGGAVASAFLRKVWRPWLKAKVLDQGALRRLDPALMQALDNEFRGRRAQLLQLLPTRSQMIDAELARHGWSRGVDAKLARNLKAAAKRRQNKK